MYNLWVRFHIINTNMIHMTCRDAYFIWHQICQGKMMCFTPLLHQLWTNYPSTNVFIAQVVSGYTFYVCLFYILRIKLPFEKQFSQKMVRKWRFLVTFCWHFFLFSRVKIIRKPQPKEFCFFKNIVLSKNDLGRELCSFFFHFFIFYANL